MYALRTMYAVRAELFYIVTSATFLLVCSEQKYVGENF
jgi:hypothetical protein